jgi:hypothetical protein
MDYAVSAVARVLLFVYLLRAAPTGPSEGVMTAMGSTRFCFFRADLGLTKPLGIFMARPFEASAFCTGRPIERLIYRLSGIKEDVEQWTQLPARCRRSPLRSSFSSHRRLQGYLPLNPQFARHRSRLIPR